MTDKPLPEIGDLYDGAPCGLLLLADDCTVLKANATFCRWIGHAPGDLVGKRRLPELFANGGRIFFHTHLQPLLRIQGSVSEVKLQLRCADNRVLPMILNMQERTVDGRKLLQVACFIAEDRHKYERELLLQRKRAEELAEQHVRDQDTITAARAQAEDRALLAEQLVGMVSHDIRNPLSVIHMSTLLLDRGISAEQQKTVVGRISRAVQRVQHLIADLLDFTQTRLGGGLRVERKPLDLHRTIAEAVHELALAFPNRTIRMVQGAASGECEADGDRIAQALGNLVANAANHGAADSVIEVRTEGDEARLRITVHNHGRPIPPDLLPTLFEPMVRGEHGSTAAKGLGLGLYIVRAIVTAHGGEVRARSTAEEGTAFTIELPRRAY